MGSHPVRAPDFAFIGPAYLISKLLRTLISPNAWLLTNTSVPIFSHNFLQKNSGWGGGGGGGVYYTSPSIPILIKYKQEGVGIRVK